MSLVTRPGLPEELLCSAFSCLSGKDLVAASGVCHEWRSAIENACVDILGTRLPVLVFIRDSEKRDALRKKPIRATHFCFITPPLNFQVNEALLVAVGKKKDKTTDFTVYNAFIVQKQRGNFPIKNALDLICSQKALKN